MSAVPPVGSRGVDRVPARLRGLTPTVETLVMPDAQKLTGVKTDGDGKRVTEVLGYGRAFIRARRDRGANRRQARAVAQEARLRAEAIRLIGQMANLHERTWKDEGAKGARIAERVLADRLRRERLNYRRSVARTHGYASIAKAVRAGVLPR